MLKTKLLSFFMRFYLFKVFNLHNVLALRTYSSQLGTVTTFFSVITVIRYNICQEGAKKILLRPDTN